jgi:REP element-mobilizing transposase RayT
MNIPTSPVTPHAHDLRKGRFSEPGNTYLLTAVVHKRRPIFTDWSIGRLLVAELRATEEDGLAESQAWVVMPDHLHWLITLQTGTISRLMQRIKGRSAISINHLLCNQGQLWQKGFHDRAIRKEEDLQAIARYVVANPLRANLVDKIGDYPLWDAIWLR